MLRTFNSLFQRNFLLFWSGQIISLMGSWMQAIGQTWLVLELSHNAWQLGLVGTLQALPVLLLSLFGGVLSDRWPKRRVLLITQIAAMIQALLFWGLITTGTIQLWHLYILAILLGLTNSLSMPTSRAFVTELIRREDLSNAIALNSSIATLARIVGPGLAGIIIAIRGVSILFLLNALSFLPVIIGLALIKGSELHIRIRKNERQKIWLSIHEGLAYVWQTPVILLVILMVGLTLLFGSNFNILLPLFARDILHGGATDFGFLSTAFGVGALLSALWMAWSSQKPTISSVLIGMLLFGILEVFFALSHTYLPSLILIASIGFTETAFATLAMATLQTTASDHMQGRVISIQVLFFDGSVPLGYLLIGALSSLYGASIAMLIGALLSLIVTGAGWIWWRTKK